MLILRSMLAKLLVIATVLGASGCVADESAAVSDNVARPVSQSAQLDVPAPPDRDPEDDATDGCVAAATDGPCSLACVNEALVDRFVPENTCAVFDCPLADGSEIRVGGCH
jgi:hypothetical protein